MDLRSHTGNGGAVTILPPTPTTIRGRSLANRKLDKRQRACLAADVVEGLTAVAPTQAQAAAMLGVSATYIQIARKLPPGKRAAILHGFDPTSFAELKLPRHLALPIPDAKVMIKSEITDTELEDLARTVGVDRMLAAAVAVEHG